MAKQRIRHLPVTAPGGELLGIVTDRDVRLSLPSQATSLSVWELNHLLSKLTVEEVMTRTVITVGPDRPARDAAQLMVDHQIGALPVEDGGRLVGIVTETDMLRAFIRLEAPPGGARAPAPPRGAGQHTARVGRRISRGPSCDRRAARAPSGDGLDRAGCLPSASRERSGSAPRRGPVRCHPRHSDPVSRRSH
jgi:CBS-domain-containing membrane protein